MTARALQRALVAGFVIASMLVTGCGSGDRQVLGPNGTETPSTAEANGTGQDASSGLIGSLGGLLGSVTQGALHLVGGLVNGLTGGVLTNGRYKVTFAPGAFSGNQYITVTDLGRSDGQVELGPHGLTFSDTVTLEIDLRNTQWDSPHATIEWYDPSTGQWVDMQGTYNPSTHKVKVDLPHFSAYRPRAGW